MTSVFTARLAQAVSTGPTVLLYTGPSQIRTVVRDMVAQNNGSVDSLVTVWLNLPGDSLAVIWQVGVPVNKSEHIDMRQVINPGEQLFFQGSSTISRLMVTGYQFALA